MLVTRRYSNIAKNDAKYLISPHGFEREINVLGLYVLGWRDEGGGEAGGGGQKYLCCTGILIVRCCLETGAIMFWVYVRVQVILCYGLGKEFLSRSCIVVHIHTVYV